MPNQYSIYRVICSTPPGLEEERDLFMADLSAFSEQVSMPQWVLFGPASFPNGFNATLMQGAVKENIAGAVFFLGFFGEDPTEPVFKRFVQYAMECAADPALPLKKATVFFKESEDVAEGVRALRDRFAGQCEVRTYRNLKDLRPQLQETLTAWLAAVTGDRPQAAAQEA
jgi:hypothetical protein